MREKIRMIREREENVNGECKKKGDRENEKYTK